MIENYEPKVTPDSVTVGYVPERAAEPVPAPLPPARWTRAFWVDLGERSLSTFLQTATGLIPASAVLLESVPWAVIASGSALAAVLAAAKAVIKALPAE